METTSIQKQRTVQTGKPCRLTKKYHIFNKSVKVVDKDTGEVLGIFLKNYISDPKIIEAGRNLMIYKASTNLRREAAGINTKKIGKYKGSMGKANNVNSSIVGFSEGAGGLYRCRMTRLYKKHYDKFNKETMQLIKFINRAFSQHAKKQYTKQRRFVQSLNQNMRLGKTVYTTCTVNVDFRTMAHRDKGDFDSGLGNLAVFNTDNFTSAELLLPEYYVAFKVEEGDLLFFNVHEVHCNNPIKGKGRVSLVCYAREKIKGKCDGVSKKALESNARSKALTGGRPKSKHRRKSSHR